MDTVTTPRYDTRPAHAKPFKKPRGKADKRLAARTFKYLSMWTAIYDRWGWAGKTDGEKADLRHGINVDLFGEYIPPSWLSNEQFSIMRYALELLYNEGILVWSKEMAELAVEEGLRRIYIWWIEHAGLDVEGITEYGAPEEYISAIARGRFGGVADWRTLDSKRLWQLFITIKNRVKAAKRRGASLWHTSAAPETSEDCPF